jgi:predicted nucleic acid-binding Zn ribbon protein
MRPADHRIAQAIGLPEQEPEVCPDTPGDGPDYERRRRKAQQALMVICACALVVVLMGHGCSELSMCFARQVWPKSPAN